MSVFTFLLSRLSVWLGLVVILFIIYVLHIFTVSKTSLIFETLGLGCSYHYWCYCCCCFCSSILSARTTTLLTATSDIAVTISGYRLTSHVRTTMNKNIPSSMSLTGQNLPWLTTSLKQAIRKKHKMYSKAKRSNLPQDWNKYKQHKKQTQKFYQQVTPDVCQWYITRCYGHKGP